MPPSPEPPARHRLQRGAALVGMTSLTLLGLGALLVHGVGAAGGEDAVLEWNRIGLAAGATLARGTSEQRELAMMHLAIHDALQSIDPLYAPYLAGATAHPDGDPDAAVATAAHDVLVATVPEQRDSLDASLSDALDRTPAGRSRSEGERAGHEAARAILALRAHDGADCAETRYDGTPGIGAWEPTPPHHLAALLPGWRDVAPFAMHDAAQFRAPPPPAVGSAEYARQYATVKALGGEAPTQRTADQSETARFWSGPINEAWNDIARKTIALRAPRSRDAHASWRNARTFALLNMALADGFVSGWDGKYHYRYWRPITAIHRGDADGNPATAPDAGWSAYLPTPEHPDYPSTHSVLSGAASTVLRCALGTTRTDVELTSRGHYAGITRRITDFDAAAAEIAWSRVWAGAHFPIANAVGLVEGRGIGRLVCDAYLRPLARR